MVGYHAAMNHFLRCHFYADRTRYVEAAGASDWYRETSSHYVPKVRSECRRRDERPYHEPKNSTHAARALGAATSPPSIAIFLTCRAVEDHGNERDRERSWDHRDLKRRG